MTRGKIRVIAHRRRREGRTDYRQRLALLRSGKARLVIRRSLNSITCQIVRHNPNGDQTAVTVSSGSLKSFGWKGSYGNLPAAYLTGMLCGIEAKKKGIKEAVLDMGLHTSTKGSRIYSALKGCLDAGIDVPHSADILPPVERIRGLHIEEHLKSKGKAAGIPAMFDEVKKKISSGLVKKAAKKGDSAKTKKPTAKGAAKSSAKKPAGSKKAKK